MSRLIWSAVELSSNTHLKDRSAGHRLQLRHNTAAAARVTVMALQTTRGKSRWDTDVIAV